MTDAEKLKNDAIRAGIKRVVAEKRKSDPLAGPKMGCIEVNARIMRVLKDANGVHVESFLSVLGSLAGYACQVCVREELEVPQKTPENVAFVIVQGKDGTKYFFGDHLNKPLVESQYSIWSLIAGIVEHLGKVPPDVGDIFKRVSETVGTDQFGVPRIPQNHTPSALPIRYVKDAWPQIFPIAKDFCDSPGELPILFGLAIQETIISASEVIDPTLAATIAMECAVPMSKIDLDGYL